MNLGYHFSKHGSYINFLLLLFEFSTATFWFLILLMWWFPFLSKLLGSAPNSVLKFHDMSKAVCRPFPSLMVQWERWERWEGWGGVSWRWCSMASQCVVQIEPGVLTWLLSQPDVRRGSTPAVFFALLTCRCLTLWAVFTIKLWTCEEWGKQ